MGRAGPWDIGWLSSPIGAVGCTAFVLRDRRGGPCGALGHRLAVVAYRDGQLHCSPGQEGGGAEEESGGEEERTRRRRGGEGGTEENQATSTLTVGNKNLQ